MISGPRRWLCRILPTGRWRRFVVICVLTISGWSLLPFAFQLPPQLSSDPPPSFVITDRNGLVLDNLARPDYFRHEPISLSDVPPALIDATLVAEDKRFFSHGGIDYLAVARATKELVLEKRVVSGASTITQQLVKISSPPGKRNLFTKIREALTARHLEYRWSKEEILTAYLNRLDYGNHRQGCREAARFYLSKPLSDLSLGECSLLAGLPQSPTLHDPLRNPQSALQRRAWILQRLLTERNYDSDRISVAMNEPLHLGSTPSGQLAPHLVSSLRSHRSSVDTTLDALLQKKVLSIVREERRRLRRSNARHAAVVVIDNTSGEVLSLVGSGDFHDPRAGQVDGTRSPRSAGSTLKPFTYLLALQRGELFPGSIVADIPTPYRTEEGLDLPVNYDRAFHGPVTIRYALANSLNVAAMRTLNTIGGPVPLHTLLGRFGIQTLDRPATSYGLGLTIGNAEVSLLELTNAYATLARLGTFKSARLILDEEASRHDRQINQIAAPTHCYMISDILSDNAARLAAFGPHSPLRLPFRVAVKTGTSSDFRDNWCIGFTGDFTVGVWVGNFDNSPMRGVSGVSGAGPIFRQTMLALHENRTPKWLKRPDGLAGITIDTRTGHRFLSKPRDGHPFTATELCLSDKLPEPVQPADYDNQNRALIDERYLEWFSSADNHRTDDLAIAPKRPDDLTPRIISPMETATYLLDPELPSGGRFLSLVSNLPKGARWSSPTLHINGTTADLTPGQHEIILTDSETGRRVSQSILVESL